MTTLTKAPKTRKPATKPQRRVQIGTATNGVFALHMTIGEGEKAKHFGYYVSRIAADFGLGFHLEKFGTEQEQGEPSAYDVNLDLQHGKHTCECKGHQRWNHCKHTEALVRLIQSGKIPVPTAKPEVKQPYCSHCNDNPNVWCEHCTL